MFARIFNFCFSPSAKMSPVPHYLYDLLHESPFKVLYLLEYEFLLGRVSSTLFTLSYFLFFSSRFHTYLDCNLLFTAWLFGVFLGNIVTILPRFLIAEQIRRVKRFIEDFNVVEGNERMNVLRNLLWNQLFQTKIYYFTQTILQILSLFNISGLVFIIFDSIEHGFFKCCPHDKSLKPLSVIVVSVSLIKFIFLKRKLGLLNSGRMNLKTGVISREQSKKYKDEDKVCSICLQEFEENQEAGAMKCGHFFHRVCIEGWLKIKGKCPLCNKIS